MVFRNREMELPEHEMELFLPFPVIGSKNFLNGNIPIWSNEFEIENVTLKRCSPSQPYKISLYTKYQFPRFRSGRFMVGDK